MVEVLKFDCSVKGCDCTAGRVVAEGDALKLEFFNRRHHGRQHDPQVDLRSLLAKIKRAQPELLVKNVSKS